MVEGPLELNMLLGNDYVYVMHDLVYTLFPMMHFSHNGSVVTIDELTFVDTHHY